MEYLVHKHDVRSLYLLFLCDFNLYIHCGCTFCVVRLW